MTRARALVPADRLRAVPCKRIPMAHPKCDIQRRNSHERTNIPSKMDAAAALEPADGAHHDPKFATDSSAGGE